jgi:hypothetical protein
MVTDVSIESSDYIFRVKQSKKKGGVPENMGNLLI